MLRERAVASRVLKGIRGGRSHADWTLPSSFSSCAVYAVWKAWMPGVDSLRVLLQYPFNAMSGADHWLRCSQERARAHSAARSH
eukprot:3123986-Rhodomonas_salina.2